MKKSKLISVLSATVLTASCTATAVSSYASASDKSLSTGSTSLAFDISPSTENGVSAANPKATAGFVWRMYNIALNREPDAKGLNNWVTKLNNHTATATDIIDGFFFSDEYKGKKKSADEMITDCYKAMLDRSPDATGMANWKKRFDVGMSMQAICKGFVGSDEFKGLCKTYGITPGTIKLRLAKDENYERTYFVYRLYKNCLGRTPDGAGLESWCKQIKSGKTGSQVGYGFVFSNEHMAIVKKEYGTEIVKKYVTDLYRAFLGREPDSAGMETWYTNIFLRNHSFQYAFNGFLMSNEFKQQCAKAGIKVGNKLADPNDLNVSDYPEKIFNGINKERAKKGIATLKTHPAVTQLLNELEKYYADVNAPKPDAYKTAEALGIDKTKIEAFPIRTSIQCSTSSFGYHEFSYTYTTADDIINALTENPSQPYSFGNITLDPKYKYAAVTAKIGTFNSDGSKQVFYSIILIG